MHKIMCVIPYTYGKGDYMAAWGSSCKRYRYQKTIAPVIPDGIRRKIIQLEYVIDAKPYIGYLGIKDFLHNHGYPLIYGSEISKNTFLALEPFVKESKLLMYRFIKQHIQPETRFITRFNG